MEKQLHVGNSNLVKGQLRPLVPHLAIKAGGGLWTSTYESEYGSDWVQWCLAEEFRVPKDGKWASSILVPSKDARIYTVNDEMSAKHLMEKYPVTEGPLAFFNDFRTFGTIDFNKVAEDYDAVSLTREGQWATRWSEYSMYGWDCESTHWFRWKFDWVIGLGDVKYKEEG